MAMASYSVTVSFSLLHLLEEHKQNDENISHLMCVRVLSVSVKKSPRESSNLSPICWLKD
jgi:hypothetical protein